MEQETRRTVIDAAVASILERGFYRASSNEIARRAGVTWGVIQHHFGTREALMLAVLQDGAEHFTETMSAATIDAPTVTERIEQLLEALAAHYAKPRYLAYMQVALNMDNDPATSAVVRSTMLAVSARSADRVREMVVATLGSTSVVPDIGATLFHALRGFLVSEQLVKTMAYDTTIPQSDRVTRQRRLLCQMLAPLIEELSQ